MTSQKRALITGAGGFIGHHLVKRLKREGYWVRGVDIKSPEFNPTEADEFELLDLRSWENCLEAVRGGINEVYNLAADMGGMGFISFNNSRIIHSNALINLHMLEASRIMHIRKFFYSSSACIYPKYKQTETNITPLKESDAYPSDPEDAYGWEKLLTEKACEYFHKDHHLDVKIARFHNIYGPEGTFEGGREKAPAAISRKVALAKDGGELEIWGDGKQTRSFCYIDDCLEGIRRLMESSYNKPLNIGSDQMVSIDELSRIVAGVAGKKLTHKYVAGPQGVRGRNSDNSQCWKILGWMPQISLEEGMRKTYNWIKQQLDEKELSVETVKPKPMEQEEPVKELKDER